MLQVTKPLFLSQPQCWEDFDIHVGAFVVLEGSIDDPIRIGQGCRIGNHVYVAPGVVLGNNVAIDTMSFIGHGTTIGDGSAVHSVKVFEQITIGRNSFIGGEVSNWTSIGDDVTFMGRIVHTYRKAGTRADWIGSEPKPSPRIGNRAVIGENAMLIGGVDIGEGAYVSAGEIVKCDVPPEHLAIGGRLVPLAQFRGFIQSRR